MSSDTSSENDNNNINYLDNYGKNILSDSKIETKKQTSDTDFYFDMIANKDKIIINDSPKSESSENKLSNISDTSRSSKSYMSSKKSSVSKSSNKSNIEILNFSNNQNFDNNYEINNNESKPTHQNFENKPTHQQNFENKPTHQQNFENKPSYQNFENKPSYQQNFENKPSYQQNFENKPTHQQNFENKPTHQQNFENKPTHQQNFENKPTIPNISTVPILATTTLPVLDTVNKILTPQETRIKKIELLRRLSEIKTKGYNLTKEYDFNSSIEEMEYEYALLKSFADKRNGIKLYKNFLLNTVSLVEFTNEKYDPFDFKLEGWSEHMSVEVDSWDDILEELYEKYKTSGGSWPPELKLALLIVGSGAGYHFTKSQFSGLPSGMGAGSILGKMMSENKKSSQFMSPQEINLENQKKMMKEREMLFKQQQKEKIRSASNLDENNMQPPTNEYMQPPTNQYMQPPTNQYMQPPTNQYMQPSTNQYMQPPINKGNSRDIPEIRAPENVAEILSRIKNIQSHANINTTETQEENSSRNDRLVSDVTISTSDPKKKKRYNKPMSKKSSISLDI
jgi:hypothetical protein